MELRLHTVSMLSAHLRRYLDLSTARLRNSRGSGSSSPPPIILRRCLDPSQPGRISEPLPLLIGSLCRMVAIGQRDLASGPLPSLLPSSVSIPVDSEERAAAAAATTTTNMVPEATGGATEGLRVALDSLAGDLCRLSRAMASSEPEDFGLDKVAEFLPAGCYGYGPQGSGAGGDSISGAGINLAMAALLAGTYEALMQGALVTQSPVDPDPAPGGPGGVVQPTRGALRLLLKLFDRRRRLLDLVRPGLPTPSLQRGRKVAGGGSGGVGG
ncbi:unnamed protein product, partial [Discosporangium mesarthrocarpum]